jgi:hypothetical protein
MPISGACSDLSAPGDASKLLNQHAADFDFAMGNPLLAVLRERE